MAHVEKSSYDIRNCFFHALCEHHADTFAKGDGTWMQPLSGMQEFNQIAFHFLIFIRDLFLHAVVLAGFA